MSKQPVRLGMLGAQHGHAPGKLRWLRDLQDIDLAGVYEPCADARAARESEPNSAGLPYVDDVSRLLDDPAVLGILIGGPSARTLPTPAARYRPANTCSWKRPVAGPTPT